MPNSNKLPKEYAYGIKNCIRKVSYRQFISAAATLQEALQDSNANFGGVTAQFFTKATPTDMHPSVYLPHEFSQGYFDLAHQSRFVMQGNGIAMITLSKDNPKLLQYHSEDLEGRARDNFADLMFARCLHQRVDYQSPSFPRTWFPKQRRKPRPEEEMHA